VSLSKKLKKDIKKDLKKIEGVVLVKRNPQYVLSYGGDGSILLSERIYPSIPKIVIKKSHFCHKCDYPKEELNKIIMNLLKEKFEIVERNKIELFFKGKKFVALNEVQIRNKYPTQSIRFDVNIIENKKIKNIITNSIGDGVIFSTSFGSSSYYRAVGGHVFEKGIGLALNNAQVEKRRHPEVFSESTVFEVILRRGFGVLAYDNDNNNMFILKPGDKFLVRANRDNAKFLVFKDIKVLTNYMM